MPGDACNPDIELVLVVGSQLLGFGVGLRSRLHNIPDVEMPGDAGNPDIEPVLVVGSQFLGHVGLHNVHPFRHLYLTGPETETFFKRTKRRYILGMQLLKIL
jgi:hypothetical protein